MTKNLIIYDNIKKKIHYVENVYSDSKIIKNYLIRTMKLMINLIFENFEIIKVTKKIYV